MKNFSIQIQLQKLIEHYIKNNIFSYSEHLTTQQINNIIHKQSNLDELLYCFMFYNNNIEYDLFNNNIKIVNLNYLIEDLVLNQPFYEGLWSRIDVDPEVSQRIIKFHYWLNNINNNLNNINFFDAAYILAHIHYNLYYLNLPEESIQLLQNKYNKNTIKSMIQEINKILCFNKLQI